VERLSPSLALVTCTAAGGSARTSTPLVVAPGRLVALSCRLHCLGISCFLWQQRQDKALMSNCLLLGTGFYRMTLFLQKIFAACAALGFCTGPDGRGTRSAPSPLLFLRREPRGLGGHRQLHPGPQRRILAADACSTKDMTENHRPSLTALFCSSSGSSGTAGAPDHEEPSHAAHPAHALCERGRFDEAAAHIVKVRRLGRRPPSLERAVERGRRRTP